MTAVQLIYTWSTLTADSGDTLLSHPVGERPAGLPVAVLVCVVPHNKSSCVDPGGLKGCRETKLVLLAGERIEVQSFACTAGGGGGCGHVTITGQSCDCHMTVMCGCHVHSYSLVHCCAA